MEAWKLINVAIPQGDPEVDADGVFSAYTTGDEWNGWATPFFTREEGDRVAAWTEAMARRFPPDTVETVRWDEALGSYVLESPEEPHQPDQPIPGEDIVSSVNTGDHDVYGIGAYRWTWETVDSES